MPKGKGGGGSGKGGGGGGKGKGGKGGKLMQLASSPGPFPAFQRATLKS